MFDLWDTFFLPEKTKNEYYAEAMNKEKYVRDLTFMKKHFDFDGVTVVDLGCGWGGMTSLLVKEPCERVYAVDQVPDHLKITALQSPGCQTVEGNVCNLDMFDDNSIDLCISHGVIEHIDTFNARGPCFANKSKQKHVYEMYRILRPGGKAYISTGNFNFPFDGEVEKMFFHWLPGEYQRKWLEVDKGSADTYTLLTWMQLYTMINNARLGIVEIKNFDVELWRGPMENLKIPKHGIDLILDLIENNPEYMSSWHIILEKAR